jgi:hypothetical protein
MRQQSHMNFVYNYRITPPFGGNITQQLHLTFYLSFTSFVIHVELRDLMSYGVLPRRD